MRKVFFIFMLSTVYLLAAYAQSEPKPLDGRKFEVSIYIDNQIDSHQTLAFDTGRMSFSDAVKYGFKAEEYKSKQKNDSTWTFLSVSKSAKNGVMTWEGKVINDRTEGTCTWTRLVENPVKYTFKGKEMLIKK